MEKVLAGLFPDHRYVVRVRAFSHLGVASDWSEAFDFQTPSDASVPLAPFGLATEFVSPDLFITWSQPTSNTDGTPLVDLHHYTVTLTANATSFTYETMQGFFAYSFAQNKTDFGTPQPVITVEVRAVDVAGNSSTAVTAVATNPLPSMPPAPEVMATFTLATVIMTSNVADPDIKEYALERSLTGVDADFVEVTRSRNDAYVDTITQDVTHYYRFRTIDYFDQVSPYSPIVSAISAALPPIDETPPNAVQDFVVVANNLDPSTYRPYIDVSWSPNNVDADLSYYELRIMRVSDSFVMSHIIGPGASTYRVSDLDESTQYKLLMYAYDYTGNRSAASAELTVTTLADTSVPAAPTGSGVIVGFRSLTVYWENVSHPQLSHYEVYASKVAGFTPGSSNLVFEGVSTRYLHTGLSDAETWYFRVRAVNNNSTTSTFTLELSGTTTDGITAVLPGEPTGAQFRMDAAGNIWIGNSDFLNAPFRVSNVGAAQMRNAVITGDQMPANAEIIDTPAFSVTNEGKVTASDIVATGGTIGGVTIQSTKLTGGTIEGATFNIGTGGINFTGSGNITWDANALGKIIVSNSGTIQSTNWDNTAETGWQLGANGLTIWDGTINSEFFQFGVSNQNLLVNSSFEDGSTVATNWTSYAGTAVGTFAVSTEFSAFQSKSQKLTITTAGDYIGLYQDVTPVSAFETDKKIAVSFYVRQTAGTARTAKVFVQTTDGITTVFDGSPVTLTVNGWTRVTAVLKPTAAHVALRFGLRILNSAASDVFYIDGAQVVRSDFLVDYAPRPLEIPTNYIQSAYISSLTADKLASGTISTAELTLTSAGIIRNSPQTFSISASGATFENGAITLVGAGSSGTGYVKIDSSSLRLIAGTTDDLASTRFKVDATGVYIGGGDAGSSDVYFSGGKTVFKSSGTGYTFAIDSNPTDTKLLKLLAGTTENFSLDTAGNAFFRGSVTTLAGSSISGAYIDSINAGKITAGTLDASKITVTNLSASSITTGTMSAAHITSGTMSADRLYGGTISGNNVSVTNISASNITSGSLSADRISGGTITGAALKTTINSNNNNYIIAIGASAGTNSYYDYIQWMPYNATSLGPAWIRFIAGTATFQMQSTSGTIELAAYNGVYMTAGLNNTAAGNRKFSVSAPDGALVNNWTIYTGATHNHRTGTYNTGGTDTAYTAYFDSGNTSSNNFWTCSASSHNHLTPSHSHTIANSNHRHTMYHSHSFTI